MKIIYDTLRHRGKPRLGVLPRAGENLGVAHVSGDLHPVFLGTAGYWHRPGQQPTKDRVLRSIDRMWSTVRAHGECFPQPPLVCVDLEQRHVTLESAMQVLDWIKEEMPHLAITCYAPYNFAPLRLYWSTWQWAMLRDARQNFHGYQGFKRNQDLGRKDYEAKYHDWREANDRTRFVQDMCDVITVPLYPPYANADWQIRERWAIWATEMIIVSKALWPSKPLVPWIWDTTGPGQGFTPVGIDNWKFMITHLHQLSADAIGVWGSKHDSWEKYVDDGYYEALVSQHESWPDLLDELNEEEEDDDGDA